MGRLVAACTGTIGKGGCGCRAYATRFLELGCYHGDYDQHIQVDDKVFTFWSDDRDDEGNGSTSDDDTDVWFQIIDLTALFADDFETGDTSRWSLVEP